MLVGCVGNSPQPLVKKIQPNQKAFAEEDEYIIFALNAEEFKNYDLAVKYYNILYNKSKKKEYLYHLLQNMLFAKKYKEVIKKVDAVSAGSYNDFILDRVKILALINLKRWNLAAKTAQILVEKSKNTSDYMLISDIYKKERQFDIALKYLDSAYMKNYNEKILDKMAIMLYVDLHRKKDAIAQLETYIRTNGCSKLICLRLIGFYSNDNNIDGILSTYLRLYQVDKDKNIAKRIIQIYEYKKDYIKIMDFLESSHSDDALLLKIYVNLKNYNKAYPLAKKLYLKSNDINYLGENAIYEYEGSKDKSNKKMLNRVISKLTKVIRLKKSPMYLNYIGYILIDNGINIKKGIVYIKEALHFEPHSVYYLDSLAWGYYKLGECKKADKIMKEISSLESVDNKEMKKHFKLINKCINNYKKGKR